MHEDWGRFREPWMMSCTSTSLLLALKDPNNSQAWTMFMEKYRPVLTAYARRRGLQPADADDVAGDVLLAFVLAHREGRYDRSKGKFRHWLGQIAKFKTADAIRRLMKREYQSPEASGTGLLEQKQTSQVEGYERLWDQEWERFVLDSCLRKAKMSFDERTLRAFEMCGVQGRAPEDVSREMGMSRNAVYAAKSRVLRTMRETREELESALWG